MSYPNIASFLGVDPANYDLRESIRQDLLIERYTDLQQELEHLETLLDISDEKEEDKNNLLKINEMLFNIIDTLVPELTEEDLPERAARIKAREYVVVGLTENKENYRLAKESVRDGTMKKARNSLDNIVSQ